MSTKDALEKRKVAINTQDANKAGGGEPKKESENKEVKKEAMSEQGGGDGNSNLPPLTNEQLHNLAKNLHATMKVVSLHQHMHNEHYATHKKHEDKLGEHQGHHDLTHAALSKMIVEKGQGAQ